MWRGIEVLENGTVTLNGSTIADAENGILLRNKGVVKSVNSNFTTTSLVLMHSPSYRSLMFMALHTSP